MSAEHDEIMRALKAIQDSAEMAAANSGEDPMTSEMRNAFGDLRAGLDEALKRLDNIENHLGIVPNDELEDE
ncbi:MAG TPA: hypothetical protein P5138_01730 [Solirubrobacterales bacterium]|nr:hypothetical protein [Solirubrobacterales bacterium]